MSLCRKTLVSYSPTYKVSKYWCCTESRFKLWPLSEGQTSGNTMQPTCPLMSEGNTIFLSLCAECLFDTSFLVQQPRYRQGREAKTAKASRHTKDKHSSTIYRGEASEGGPHILLDKHRSFTQTAGKSRFTVELYSTSSRPQRAEAGKHTLR